MARPTDAKRIIKEALKVLSSPDKWTQDFNAMNHLTATVKPTSPDAVCWCLEGAFYKASHNLKIVDKESPEDDLEMLWSSISAEIYQLLKPFIPNTVSVDHDGNVIDEEQGYIEFNDQPETTYKDVINVLKRASK